ncbi:MAG: hypothetical protein KKH28_08290 [Elusimicrobia bacterium]|nr:hypothetical protein [Elusimicrobiota bacterium]
MDFTRTDYGSCLLAGLRNTNITEIMPLFATMGSSALNLGISPVLFLIILRLAVYLLIFSAGCLLRGYWAGIISLAGAGALEAAGALRYEDEQVFYGFFLLLALSLLLLKRRDNTLKNSLLCGLALGASMLVRTPLLLFPPAVVLFDWFYSRERSRAFVLRSLALLAASYVLLIPWGFLNYSISGKFSVVDGRRVACNLITGAKGSIYTMEGDPRKLAGLKPEDSAFSFFIRETLRDPGSCALTVLKRLWHIFLLYPLLFGLFLLAMAVSRERNKLLVFGMPVYFILIHSAVSIEGRYFYPMLYVLPPLIAVSFWPGRADQDPGRCVIAEKITAAAFWIVFCAVLAVEALVIAYPYRSAKNIKDPGALTRVLERFPNDRYCQEMKCKLLLTKGDDGGYYKCFDSYSKKFGDKTGAYFLAAGASLSPSELPVPAGREEMACLIIRMLREFELGDRNAARASFRQAYAGYEAKRNLLRGEPYQRDKELALLIKGNSDTFWDVHVYRAILMLPPKRSAKLSGLRKSMEFPGPAELSAQGRQAAEHLHRSARNIDKQGSLARAAEPFPNNRVLKDMKCRSLWINGDAAGYYKCLGAYNKKSDNTLSYFLAAGESLSPAELPVPAGMEMECLIIRMLREFELGDKNAAMVSFRQAYALHEVRHDILRSGPDPALRTSEIPGSFWDEQVYDLILMRPPKSASKTLFELGKSIELPRGSGLSALAEVLSLGEAGERMLITWVAAAMPGPPSGEARLLRKKAAEGSKKLSDSAVEKIISGDLKTAERFLLEAVELNPFNSEAFMNLCFIRLKENKKKRALEACQSAAYAVYFNPETRLPAFEMLAAEASFKSYELLKESDRKAEAEKALRRAVENAPAAWPGLSKARAALKKDGRR